MTHDAETAFVRLDDAQADQVGGGLMILPIPIFFPPIIWILAR